MDKDEKYVDGYVIKFTASVQVDEDCSNEFVSELTKLR